MPRKAFFKDLAECARSADYPNVIGISAGEDDGTINFTYSSALISGSPIGIQALVLPEVSEYPESHTYMLYVTGTNANDVPSEITVALQTTQSEISRLPLSRMLSVVSRNVERSLSGDINIADTEMSAVNYDTDENDEADEDTFFPSLSDDDQASRIQVPRIIKNQGSFFNLVDMRRVRSDLRATKAAGFRVSALGDLTARGFVCVSIRIAKLGISEEALHAWGLTDEEYLLLILSFQNGYRILEDASEGKIWNPSVEMRVAVSSSCKPRISDAIKAFTQIADPDPLNNQNPVHAHSTTHADKGERDISGPDHEALGALRDFFISRPLNALLSERFATIIKCRLNTGATWTGAENFFNDVQGKQVDRVEMADPNFFIPDNAGERALPALVTADAIAENVSSQTLPLPLVAMQFVIRHLVRCTEFCLVCHCRVDSTFEALKPYVCSKPLCLYQYMALGFGPTIEWEIMAQPYVVDLLVSFCYASATMGKLTDFPEGINLKVPVLSSFEIDTTQGEPVIPQKSFSAKFDRVFGELLFPDASAPCPVSRGEWIAIECKLQSGQLHYLIGETACYPTVNLVGKGIVIDPNKKVVQQMNLQHRASNVITPATTPAARELPWPIGLVDVECWMYDKNFDQLSDRQKSQAITVLLDTLPSVTMMQKHLSTKNCNQGPTLRTWRGHISEPALNLLRWIIASNRSCIIQVDRISAEHALGSNVNFTSGGSFENRVSGMDEWMQFRFAQGAPDKEQRFVDCVNDVNRRTASKYPTIFAWHGSPFSNWHSIVRQGLRFDNVVHGRAYGNGVYMSKNLNVSMGYCHAHTGIVSGWPNSILQISSAISLNEVVNAPAEFVSRNPHYVVADIDWIQTRYLFIQTVHKHHVENESVTIEYKQDPQLTALGLLGPVAIPISAVSKSRRPKANATAVASGFKRVKTMFHLSVAPETDASSIATDDEDYKFLESDQEDDFDSKVSKPTVLEPIQKRKRTGESVASSNSKTDFVPGTLDFSSLGMLSEPNDVSMVTTKRLMKVLREALVVQNSTPSHELGWYIDHEKIINMYQWIVELHSFDPDLELARDMKRAKITSIVLELRFTNSFPFSPPFVRVIRPRFLPFLSGGGGHITAGGAICMELLTNSGWLVTNSIESLLLQVRIAISSTDPRPARLADTRPESRSVQYGVGEAIEAYKRACAMHGWVVPSDFAKLQME